MSYGIGITLIVKCNKHGRVCLAGIGAEVC